MVEQPPIPFPPPGTPPEKPPERCAWDGRTPDCRGEADGTVQTTPGRNTKRGARTFYVGEVRSPACRPCARRMKLSLRGFDGKPDREDRTS